MTKQVKIQTGKTLSAAIDAIINESMSKAKLYQNAIEEKEKRNRMSSLSEEDKDLFGSDDESDKSDEKSSEEKTSNSKDEKEKLKKGDVSSSDVIEKLNSIRAGRSLKDADIKDRLTEYIESLDKAEKIALLAFLKGISQVVTGEVEGEKATEPSDKPANVEMKKKEGQKKSIKPTVIKSLKKDEKEEEKPASKEDTTPPAPITPVKK